MSKNPYFNTMWTERDGEFFWTGTKFGIGAGAFITSIIAGWIAVIYKEIKKDRSSENKRA